MAQCRLRTEEGEQVLALDELEARLRAGEVHGSAWVQIPGMTNGFVRVRDSPLSPRLDGARRARFRAAFALDRFPGMVLTWAAVCLVLHAVVHVMPEGPVTLARLVRFGARARASVWMDGEVWRLWSGVLLHRDGWHLAFNLAVFVAVGGALESIYTRAGLLSVLFVGALGSSLVSLWTGPAVTVGLSGVVFATLGAAIGFGARFRDVLRRPYQHWFGVAALAYALFALWGGARSPEVDHAGHLGGLLSGLAVGLALPPRQWQQQPGRLPRDLGWLAAVVLVSAGAAGLLAHMARNTPPPSQHQVPDAGLVLNVPWGFYAGRDAFGLGAWSNGLDAQVALGCMTAQAAWPRLGSPGNAALWVTRDMVKQAPARGVLDVRVEPAGWTSVGQPPWPAQEVLLRYRADGQEVAARVLGFDRGLVRCALFLATTKGAPASRVALLDGVRTQLALGSTSAWRAAKRAVDLQPDGALAWLEWGTAALVEGDAGTARRALSHALTMAGGDSWLIARAHHGLAQLALLQLDGPEALPHANAARALLPEDVDVAVSLYGALRMAGLGRQPAARTLGHALKQVRPAVVH